jgi:hypothetical protein
MATAAAPYTKLPGRGLRRAIFAVTATRCRLWLAADHLLAVDYTIASEEYRRFYFRDIEALIVRRTAKRQVWNWVLLVLLLITAGPFFALWRSEGSGGFLITALSFTTLWAVVLLINTLRGPTCQTHIRTAVQLEELPSLSRLPVARRVLRLIQPLIIEAQGAATPEEVGAAPWMSAESQLGARTGNTPAPKAVRVDRGRLHGALFGLLIAEAILTAVAFVFSDEPISIFTLLAMLGGCIVCVSALIRQGETDLSSTVRTFAKVALGHYILKCVVGFVYMMIYAIRNPGTPMVTGLEMEGEPWFSEFAVSSAVLGALIGLFGLIALLDHLHRRAAPPAA